MGKRSLERLGLFSVPTPQSVVDIVEHRIRQVVRLTSDRYNARIAVYPLMMELAVNAYLQGFADCHENVCPADRETEPK